MSQAGFWRVGIFVFLVSFSQMAFGTSAYELFRNHFEKGRSPSAESLFFGHIWYCSGDLMAAKGMFRQVPYWESFYQFFENSHGVENKGPRRSGGFEFTRGRFHSKIKCNNCFQVVEFLRQNKKGDLFVEVVGDKNSSYVQKQDRKFLKRAFSNPSFWALQYYACQNPEDFNSKDWFQDPDIWIFPYRPQAIPVSWQNKWNGY